MKDIKLQKLKEEIYNEVFHTIDGMYRQLTTNIKEMDERVTKLECSQLSEEDIMKALIVGLGWLKGEYTVFDKEGGQI